MKKLFVLSTEFLSFAGLGLLAGWLLDKQFSLEGWGMIGSLLLAYILWLLFFLKSVKKQSSKK